MQVAPRRAGEANGAGPDARLRGRARGAGSQAGEEVGPASSRNAPLDGAAGRRAGRCPHQIQAVRTQTIAGRSLANNHFAARLFFRPKCDGGHRLLFQSLLTVSSWSDEWEGDNRICSTRWGKPMNTPRIVFVIALIVVLSVGAAISTLAFENSAEGIGYVFGQFLAFAIISSLLAWRVWRRSPYKAATIVLVVGTLGMALVNARKVLDGISAREASVALKDVRDPDHIDKALKQNPSNPSLQLTAFVIKKANETIRVIDKLSEEIEPPTLANEINFTTASRADLEEYVRNLRTAEANAKNAMPKVIAALKNERHEVETFA